MRLSYRSGKENRKKYIRPKVVVMAARGIVSYDGNAVCTCTKYCLRLRSIALLSKNYVDVHYVTVH